MLIRGGIITAALTLALAGGASAQTTLDQTIEGDPSAAYSTLSIGPGWERIVRDDLAAPQSGREDARSSLLYFVQMSDMHVIDEESPSRVELLDLDGTPFTSAWRPWEALSTFMNDAAVRGVNAFTASPVTGAPLEFAITTGDSADNMQLNETEWVVKLLEGGTLDPNSGVEPTIPCGTEPGEAARYTGVQDYDDYTESDYFYDPDQPQGRHADWPQYPGLMDRAQQPFETPGLAVPSYVAFGNHDGLAQGNNAAIAGYEAIGTGCLKPFGPAPFDGTIASTLLQSSPSHLVAVPPDEKRQYVNKPKYRELHSQSDDTDMNGVRYNHGFAYVDEAEQAASNRHASYYSFSPKRGFRFISLDTVAEGGLFAANGNIDDPQFQWLSGELDAAEAADELVVVFGHHPIRSLNIPEPDEMAPPCVVADRHGHDVNPGCDLDHRDSQPVRQGADLQALLLAHPHVLSYVAGHTHEHNITPFKAGSGESGFWGIETASEIDWPVQSRLLDVVDNNDGTLSIIGTVIDQASPVSTPAPGSDANAFSTANLASLGRELAFNDYQSGARSSANGSGDPDDRNVELLLNDPRD